MSLSNKSYEERIRKHEVTYEGHVAELARLREAALKKGSFSTKVVEQYAEAEEQLIKARYHYNNLDKYVSLKQSELKRDLALSTKV